MRRLIEISRTGVTAILLHPLRSWTTVCALLAILVPFLVGLGLAKGLERDAEISLRSGGDLYVRGSQFGRSCPIPLTLVTKVREVEGVVGVTPRIVGRLRLGRDSVEAIVVGIPASEFPFEISCINGRLPQPGKISEFVVGTELARRLKLHSGALIPPFYRNSQGEHVSRISGIFVSDVSLWQASLMFGTFASVEKIFGLDGLATDLVIRCRRGYEENVSRQIRKLSAGAAGRGTLRLSITSRKELEVMLASGQFQREGLYNLHFVLAFVIGILVILASSGAGQTERRREIGILKATGWQTDEILLRSLVESLLLSLGGAMVSIVLAFIWLRLLNGYGIAGIFFPGVSSAPSFPVPFRLTPVPAFLAFLIAFAITMSGTVWSTWRTAIVSPDEAMR